MKICANNLNIIVPCQQRLKRLDTFHRTVYHRGGNMQASSTSEQRFLLSNTPTTEHRIAIEENTAVLSTTTRFVLGASDMQTLTWFLQAVKANKAVRHTFTDENWTLEYDLDNNDLDRLVITRRATGREITMSLSTAYKLLDALTGKIERLVKE